MFERTRDEGGKLVGDGETFRLDADIVFSAIGQLLTPASFGGDGALNGKDGRILVDDERRTSARRRLGGRRLRLWRRTT